MEADLQAVVNVIATGIHPDGIPDFFQTLIAERRRNPNVLENFFASHPLEESRVGALTRDDAGFRTFKSIVAALPPAPSQPSQELR